jgi:hypothetical protein
MGNTKTFHDGLRSYLRRYKNSPLWDNLLAILNDLRVKSKPKLKPMKREELLEDEEPVEQEGRR